MKNVNAKLDGIELGKKYFIRIDKGSDVDYEFNDYKKVRVVGIDTKLTGVPFLVYGVNNGISKEDAGCHKFCDDIVEDIDKYNKDKFIWVNHSDLFEEIK